MAADNIQLFLSNKSSSFVKPKSLPVDILQQKEQEKSKKKSVKKELEANNPLKRRLNIEHLTKPKVVKKKKLAESEDAEKKDKSSSNSHGKDWIELGRNQIISSLFKGNPAIPDMTAFSDDVEQKTEEVFSKDEFGSLGLQPNMTKNLEHKMGFKKMTSIQQLAIPTILKGRDVLIKSQTGSGKTLAYALPIIHNLQNQTPKVKRSDGPYAIVIVPTRELAIQSMELFKQLVQPTINIVPGHFMGGEHRGKEKTRLRKGINVLISTPGRLLDHLRKTACLVVKNVRWIVIDEADRLLDLGFEKPVAEILEVLKERVGQNPRQSLLLSATLSSGVERLAGLSLDNPAHVSASDDIPHSAEESHATPDTLDHYYCVVPHKLRLVTLATFILWRCTKKHKMIVFFATQDSVDFHHELFTHACYRKNNQQHEENEELDTKPVRIFDLPIYKLHGDMPQKDVASRGLDLPHVRWILQYNVSTTSTDYIHRAGRTARVGSDGNALLFLAPSEVEYVGTLKKANINLQEVQMNAILGKLPKLMAANATLEFGYPTIENYAVLLQKTFEILVQQDSKTARMARDAYQSFVQSYGCYPRSLKHIFNVKNLHLGHSLKGFCIHDSPSNVGAKITEEAELTKPVKKRENKNYQHIKEYSSGVGQTGNKMAARKKFKHI